MDKTLSLYYYIVKRVFLFLDEWLFYFVLYILYRKGYRKITLTVLLYGLSCIYTSYSNIERVEGHLTGFKQSIWLIDLTVLRKLFQHVFTPLSNWLGVPMVEYNNTTP